MPELLYEIDPGYLSGTALHQQYTLLSDWLHDPQKAHCDNRLHYWLNYRTALTTLLNLVTSEIALRSTQDPQFHISEGKLNWPQRFEMHPSEQLLELPEENTTARIHKPRNEQSLWAQHKYSIMARDQQLYLKLGPAIARKEVEFPQLIEELSYCKRLAPSTSNLRNSIWHMWGYVSQWSDISPGTSELYPLMKEIQKLAFKHQVEYLLNSTALGDLAYWAWSYSQTK